MNFTPQKLFKTFAFAEAVTWTLLITGLILRATVGIPAELFTVIGGTHGAVFLAYGVIAALVGVNNRWSVGRIVVGAALAIVPYATIPFERSVEKRGMLLGEWRKEATGHHRDNHWFDRLFRWFMMRPMVLFLVLVLVVAVIFATLLTLGPPGGSKD